MKPFCIEDPVHEQLFWVAINTPFKELERFIRRHYQIKDFSLEEGLKNAQGFVFDIWNKDKYGIWIYMKGSNSRNIDWLATLNHEVSHAAKILMSNRGFDLQHPTDEPLAYEVSFLTKQILKKVRTGR